MFLLCWTLLLAASPAICEAAFTVDALDVAPGELPPVISKSSLASFNVEIFGNSMNFSSSSGKTAWVLSHEVLDGDLDVAFEVCNSFRAADTTNS